MKIKPKVLKKYPTQGKFAGKSVNVLAYGKTYVGKIVRDDEIEPHRFLIKLDNGQILTGSECRWSIKKDEKSQQEKPQPNEQIQEEARSVK